MPYPISINIIGKSVRLLRYHGVPEQVIKNEVTKLLKGEIREHKRRFDYTVLTWRNKPNFYVDIDTSGDDWYASVETDSKIYFYLDNGTTVRYATMHPKFKAKTVPGRIKSTAGSDYQDPVYVRRDKPRPGIEARHFTDNILDRRRKPFEQKSRAMMRRLFFEW